MKMNKWVSVVLFLALLVSVVGCSTGGGKSNTASEAKPGQSQSAAPASEPEETLEIKWQGNGINGLYPEKDSYVVQELNKRFNVKLIPVKADSKDDKEMNLLFASGEIPDHFLVYETSIDNVIKQGLSRTIPIDMIKSVAPNLWESTLKNYPNLEQMSIYNDGQLLALPEGTRELFQFTAVRTDWLNNVGAKMPTNLDEFEEVARLFTEADPDGNGKDDTYAFTITAEYSNIYTIAAAFGISLPGGTVKSDSWREDDTGRLVHAQVSPNYKKLIAYLANLYAKGYVYPDITINKPETLFSDGIVGMKTAGWTALMPKYRPSDWFALTFKKNPEATTDYLPPLRGQDGQEAVFEAESAVWRYMTVGKDTSDAKLKKILEILEAQIVDIEVHNLIWRGTEGVHFTIDEDGMAVLTPDYSTNEKQAEVGMRFFIINNRNEEQMKLSFGKVAEEQANIQKNYKTVNQLIPSGISIPSENKYKADIDKVELEFFIKAITGEWDTDAEWDNYVTRWNAAGGKQITEEINEIYQNLKK